MAVAIIETDTWLTHLPFVGGPRPTSYGLVDGIFYGLVAGDGAAGGGNVTLNGLVSFERKEDWIYVLQDVSSSHNSANSGDVFSVHATGPLIPTGATATTVSNPSFHTGGVSFPITGNALSLSRPNTGGPYPFKDLPIFGDKKIPGTLALSAVGWETNVDGATYQMSIWGWLIQYQSFFRNRPPAFA